MIELNAPNISKKEINLTSKALNSGWVSDGVYIKLFEDKLKKYVKAKYAASCINGTSALHLALKIINANKDTEVLVPSVSFIATANAILYTGASPVFLGVNKYLNLDEINFVKFIKENTYKKNGVLFNKKSKKKIIALIVVHVFGNAARIDLIKKICNDNKIFLIEDASESLGTFFKSNKKKHTGTFGDIGCFSFNANKIITSGCGGMIVTNKKTIYKKAKFLANQAKKNSIFFEHSDIGYNYKLPNINCAIGYSQILRIKQFKKNKKKNFLFYKKYLNKNFEILVPPLYSDSNYWLNCVKLKIKKNCIKYVVNYLSKKKIQTRPVWKLLPLQKKLKNYQNYHLAESKKKVSNILCLPSSTFLKKKKIEYVSKVLNIVLDKIKKNNFNY